MQCNATLCYIAVELLELARPPTAQRRPPRRPARPLSRLLDALDKSILQVGMGILQEPLHETGERPITFGLARDLNVPLSAP